MLARMFARRESCGSPQGDCGVSFGTGGYFFLDFLDDDLLAGTLPPSRRACDSPMAIACFRLLTFLLERPLFNVPLFRSRMAFPTFSDAFLPYRAMVFPPYVLPAARQKQLASAAPELRFNAPTVAHLQIYFQCNMFLFSDK